MFDDKSRYAGLPTRSLTQAGGRTVAYVVRRMIPPPEAYVAAGGATISDSDRLDLLSYRHLGTPAGFYQIADANGAMHPQSPTAEPGKRLVIPLPLIGGGGQ